MSEPRSAMLDVVAQAIHASHDETYRYPEDVEEHVASVAQIILSLPKPAGDERVCACGRRFGEHAAYEAFFVPDGWPGVEAHTPDRAHRHEPGYTCWCGEVTPEQAP